MLVGGGITAHIVLRPLVIGAPLQSLKEGAFKKL